MERLYQGAGGFREAAGEMYPPCDIDKVRARGETWPVDPEMREALDRLGADLRGEIRTSAAEGRVYVDGSIQASAAETRAYIGERFQTSEAETRAYIGERFQTSAAETRAYVDERIQTSSTSLFHQIREQILESEARMRRHFDVVGESLRADNRSVAEGTALLSQRTDRHFDEQTGRTDGLDGRVLRLEVRVLGLEDDRKPRRPRRRR